jgi:heterodisulfide reductase subunit B
MKENASLRKEINNTLKKEGLQYEGGIEVTHLLYLLYHGVGIKAIKEKITRPHKGLKVAPHYGCHALRPSNVVQFDNPVAPTLFDQLVEATGAESIYWPTRLECCGDPVSKINDDLSMNLGQKKLMDAKQSGADYLCTACPFCHIQFDTIRKGLLAKEGADSHLPSILYPQLLGLSMGIDNQALTGGSPNTFRPDLEIAGTGDLFCDQVKFDGFVKSL